MSASGVPLLESKLHVPRRRRGVVARARLDLRLDRDALPPVALVSAPAGFGKTTLLTGWLGDETQPTARTAWVSLDRRDSDPSVFWSYIVAALRKVDPAIGADALAMLQASPTALEAVVATLLNDLTALADDLVLVLDDYHAVESIEVHESMLFLVEHLPAPLHLVIASRADPPWPLAALRARGELLEIRAADLRFTGDEAAAYLNDAMGLELAAADIDALEGRTEGWIAALQLAALSLQGREDPSAFIAGFAGDDRFVVDYLVDEVLSRQPDDIRTFLLETSILSRLSASLCAAVTGRGDAKTILEGLERSNLFLVPLDDRRHWYRYHHLFGEVLRSRLADEMRDDGATALHRRASDWFEAHDDRAEAIRHAMAAEDFARAADLIELSIPDLRQARQDATLRAWLGALPRETFDNRPVLTMGLVGSRMVTGAIDGVEAHLDAIEGWLEPGQPTDTIIVRDHVEFGRLPTQSAMYRAGLALLRGDLAAAILHGERAASLSAADDHLGLGASAALIGLANWAAGDLAAAERQYAAAIATFVRAEYLPDILGCSLGLADIQFAQGHLSAAMRTLTTALELAEANAPLRGTADMHIGLSELHLERNELDAAAEHLRAGVELGERLALPQYAYRWRVVDARLRAARGDYAGALDLLRDAEQHYNTDYSPRVRPVSATTARVRLAAGDIAGAERWAADTGLSPDDAVTYLREYEHLTYARVLLSSGRAEDAIPLLQRLVAAADAGGREGSAIEARLLVALAHDPNGDAPPTPARQGLVDELSARELQVLRLLRSDLTGPQIAAELIVSLNTVRTHTKNIFMKLGVNSRRAAVRRADELGL